MDEQASSTAAGMDPFVERIGRWLAGRATRRSFLGKVGRAGVLLASGPTVATLLADPAHGRVCGQSGVSPKCPTFDCPDGVWGWCWYATGCCSGGGLKKICDCCVLHWPNVHGYCPTSTNVKCIVESCAQDPRVQTTALHRALTDDATAIAAAASTARFGAGSGVPIVVASTSSVHAAAIAGPVASLVGGPLLLTPPESVGGQLAAELQRLGATRALLVGPGLGAGVEQSLQAYGLTVERVSGQSDPEQLSTDVYSWIQGQRGPTRAFAVATSTPAAIVAAAGAAAAARQAPLLVGADAARAAASGPAPRPALTWCVGQEAAAFAGQVPGGTPLVGAGVVGTTAELAKVLYEVEHVPPVGVGLAPEGLGASAAGLVSVGGPIVLHAAGSLDPTARDALAHLASGMDRIVLAGSAGALGDAGIYEVQSVANGYDTHRLIGVAGQGLPVIPQPRDEQPIGRARVASTPPPPGPDVWTSRASGS